MASHLVVMGVSGSGKTTIATRLAERRGYLFAEGDEFHSAANVAKMARAEPLTDADRAPWLAALAEWIAAQNDSGRSTVLACSALKRSYRDALQAGAPNHVFFLYLAVPRPALVERMKRRKGHYMPQELLDSQLATLEPLAPDEPGFTLDGALAPDAIVERALERLNAREL
jgi:gluconokinase